MDLFNIVFAQGTERIKAMIKENNLKHVFHSCEALRIIFSVFMALVIILVSTASIIPQLPSPTEAEPYLLPAERALPLKSVSIDGELYSLYFITTNNNYKSAQEWVFFKQEVKYWESHAITAVLVFDQKHNLIKDEDLLLRIFQSQIGGYFQIPQSLDPRLVPADDTTIADMSSFSQKPLYSV
ncbi:MAG TPA: hypothetical protein VLR89_02460, partial [Anaerolineaceae bacterium]|nr:hypothetical protein [Anaerolineaceae bacterium]